MRHAKPMRLETASTGGESVYLFGLCKKKVQSKSGVRCPAYGGLVCTISVALNLNMSLYFLNSL